MHRCANQILKASAFYIFLHVVMKRLQTTATGTTIHLCEDRLNFHWGLVWSFLF